MAIFVAVDDHSIWRELINSPDVFTFEEHSFSRKVVAGDRQIVQVHVTLNYPSVVAATGGIPCENIWKFSGSFSDYKPKLKYIILITVFWANNQRHQHSK